MGIITCALIKIDPGGSLEGFIALNCLIIPENTGYY